MPLHANENAFQSQFPACDIIQNNIVSKCFRIGLSFLTGVCLLINCKSVQLTLPSAGGCVTRVPLCPCLESGGPNHDSCLPHRTRFRSSLFQMYFFSLCRGKMARGVCLYKALVVVLSTQATHAVISEFFSK